MLLLTNDDGIQSPTLQGLAALFPDSSVVVAPDGNRSACSSSLTVRRDIQALPYSYDFNVPAWAVSGTPADCVQIGLDHLLASEEISRVISGINLGANLGDDVLYSGTVAGAMEGRVLAKTAIALSVDAFAPDYFDDLLELAKKIIDELLKIETPATVYNVNIPNLPSEEIRGWRWTRQGQRGRFGGVQQTALNTYRLGSVGEAPETPEEGSDFAAIQQGYISVTPLLWQNTASELLASLVTE